VAGNGRLFKTTDGAQSWRAIGATFYAFEGADTPLASASLNTIIVDPKNPLTLYAQVYSYIPGLFKSTDGGGTWYPAATPLPMNLGALPVFNPQAPSTMYLWYSDYSYPAKTGGGHLLQSTDDGTSWNDIGNGGVPAGSYLQNLTFDAKSPSIVFATYGGDEGWGLVKSTDGGKTWNQLNTGLPPYDTASIVAVSPDSTVYAGYVDLTIGRGRLVKSADGGTNWSAADSGLTYIGVLTLAIDPTNAADVYAGVGAGGEGVFKTQNPSCSQLQDHEYIKDTETSRDHNEEVACQDHLGVVADKGQPALLRIGSPPRATLAQILLYGTRRYSNSELQFQFIGNALLSPSRILSAHLPDQLTKIPGEARASDRLRLPAPEQPKPFSVPADERIRFDIHQRIAPAEHPTQGCHHPTRGIVGSSRFDSPLLEERQLLS